MPRFSANLGFLWPDRDLVARIDAAADAGFEAIELHWPYETEARLVRERCEMQGLVLLGINTPVGQRTGDFGLGALPGREAEFRAAFDEALEYADNAGATAIHVMAGIIADENKSACVDAFCRNLEYAAGRTELPLLLEPINQRDKPGYFYSTVEEALDVILKVGANNLKVMFDVYHIAISEGDVTKRLEKFLPTIGHIQVAAVPSRAEPDHGEIDYDFVISEIDRLGYKGWIGCEYRPRAGTNEGLAWLGKSLLRLGSRNYPAPTRG